MEVDSVTCNKDPQNPVSIKCSCVDPPSENGHSSDIVSSSSNSGSAASFVMVSNSSTTSNRNCCLKQRFGSIFLSTDSSDVSFVVGLGEQKQTIPAHKLVLSVGSSVFKTMFSKKWSSELAEIEIPDIDAHSFTALLRFLYTDEVALTTDTVIGILYAARKYAIKPLENNCIKFLVENLCPDNAFTILNEVRLLDIQKLVNSCLETIDKDTDGAMEVDAFCDINIKTLCQILDRDTLTISEARLFEAVLRWSEAECLRKNLSVNKGNQQSVLEEVLPLIRFPLMSIKEFASNVAPLGFFTSEELVSLYQYFATESKPCINFNDTPRSYKELTVNRFKKLQEVYKLDGLGHFIDFTCDTNVRLLGFGLSSSTSPAKYTVKLQLLDPATDTMLRDETTNFESDGVTVIYRVLFKNPVKLIAFKKYVARVYVEGLYCFAGSEGLKAVTVNLPHSRKVTVTFSKTITKECPNPMTTVDKGLIPQLIITP